MKTRVVRHWHQADWLYMVQVWTQVKPEDQWVCIDGYKYDMPPKPEIGSWYWRQYIVPNGGEPGICQFSRDRATSIASRLAMDLPQEDADVIAEFGEQIEPADQWTKEEMAVAPTDKPRYEFNKIRSSP